MTGIHLKKKDVVKSSVKGISIEFDHERPVAILDVPRRTGICEYIKEVWEESRYTKPLEITVRFANDATIMKAVRVQQVEMKPSQRFIHFLGNEKCDTSIREERHLKLLDLPYMDHLMARRLVNLPRVMMRHMSYVISMKDHESPYGDWLTLVFEAFGVPLVIKKGEEPKKYDFFEDTFLTMCKPTSGRWNMVDRKWEEEPSDVNTKQTQQIPASSSTSAEDQELAGVDPRSYSRDANFQVPATRTKKGQPAS
ncbi:hypothetical protein Dimus_020916 [Dionaea muscipula]